MVIRLRACIISLTHPHHHHQPVTDACSAKIVLSNLPAAAAAATATLHIASPPWTALPRDRQQLLEKMQSAESIVVLYDVQRPDTLTHLDTFWLPLIEVNTKARLVALTPTVLLFIVQKKTFMIRHAILVLESEKESLKKTRPEILGGNGACRRIWRAIVRKLITGGHS